MRVEVAASPASVRVALKLEYEVFSSLGFCQESPDAVVGEYLRYLDQSTFLMGRDADANPIGVLRVIRPGPHGLPAIAEFDVDTEFLASLDLDKVIEIGTLAVEGSRGLRLAQHLYRSAWKLFGSDTGRTHWLAVVEEWLLDVLRDGYHFPFEAFGIPRQYMGGLCYPVVMDCHEVHRCMREADPAAYAWFTDPLVEVPRG